MIKHWFTANELAELRLPNIPSTQQGVWHKATRENWKFRPRSASGGGFEYHVSALPAAAQIALVEKLVDYNPEALDVTIGEMEQDATQDRAILRRDARLVILKLFDVFRGNSGMGRVAAMSSFEMVYATRRVPSCPDWVYDTFPSVSWQTIHRWSQRRKKADLKGLAGRYGARLGTGVLESAKGGAVKAFIAAHIIKQPHLTASHVRSLVRAEYGTTIDGKALPNERGFRRFIAAWKAENEALNLKLTNPDSWKNKKMLAIGRADAHVERLNQEWQIDASPADVMLIDGRYSIYALIDIWSRRVKAIVTKTPRTEASLNLIRRAIMDWGVPETIKTDNGSDFTSRRFITALAALGIDQQLCQPFTPESKPHVERVIGTMQRDLMTILPGFIGHNVIDRKAIEGRKAFAKRLGEDESHTFQVSLTAEQMQAHLDKWCDDLYAQRPHSALNGMSPFSRAATWAAPLQRIENERALDLLLAPLAGGDSTRSVGKKGIRIEKAYYWSDDLTMHVGRTVFIRHDPADFGGIYVFDSADADGKYICRAVNIEREGITPEMAARAKAKQKSEMKELAAEHNREIRRLSKKPIHEIILEQAAADRPNVTVFPARAETYSSPALEVAAEATAAPTGMQYDMDERQRTVFDIVKADLADATASAYGKSFVNDEDRYWDRARGIEFRISNDAKVSADDAEWLAHAKKQPWYVARMELQAMRAKHEAVSE